MGAGVGAGAASRGNHRSTAVAPSMNPRQRRKSPPPMYAAPPLVTAAAATVGRPHSAAGGHGLELQRHPPKPPPSARHSAQASEAGPYCIEALLVTKEETGF